MAAFTKTETINLILSAPVVPVFFNPDPQTARLAIRACYRGGVRAFEFTDRSENALPVFREIIPFVREECPGMAFGAGTILSKEAAQAFAAAGADFLVSPCMVTEARAVAVAHDIPYIPGCGTVTEIYNAVRSGSEIVKVFPAGSVGGPAFVRDVLAPLPRVKLMCTGSVEPLEENVRAWAAAGAAALGMGSKLFPKEAIAAGEWDRIAQLCSSSLKWFALYHK